MAPHEPLPVAVASKGSVATLPPVDVNSVNVQAVSRQPTGSSVTSPPLPAPAPAAGPDSIERTSANALRPSMDGERTSSGVPRTSSAAAKWKSVGTTVKMSVKVSSKFTTLRDMCGPSEITPEKMQTIKVLGEGAFATVEQCSLQMADGVVKSVAVKRLKPAIVAQEDDLAAFLKEIALLRKLAHRHIVEFIGVGASDPSSAEASRKSLFLVQEFMDGGTLKKVVSRQMLDQTRHIYTYSDAFRWMLQCAKGLQYLHQARPVVIHRDLKLENLLLKGRDLKTAELKISDFGLVACVQNKERSLTVQKTIKEEVAALTKEAAEKGLLPGSDSVYSLASVPSVPTPSKMSLMGKSKSMFRRPAAVNLSFTAGKQLQVAKDLSGRTGSYMYMAPEMYNNQAYSEKVDVFSLGVIMFETFARYLTVMAVSIKGTEEEIEMYAARVANGYRPSIPQDWPPELSSLIADCWAQDQSKRPTMEAVVQRMQKMVDAHMGAEMDKALAPSCGCTIS